MSEAAGILPANHFGCRPGRNMSDSLHYVTKFVKDAWRKEVVSALFLDIKNAFLSITITQLIHNMGCRGVPAQYTNWLRQKLESRHTTLKFNGYVSEQIGLPIGINQGCLLLGIIFQFYNADLVDICKPGKGEEIIAFMDNTLILVKGKSLAETNAKFKRMMMREGGGGVVVL